MKMSPTRSRLVDRHVREEDMFTTLNRNIRRIGNLIHRIGNLIVQLKAPFLNDIPEKKQLPSMRIVGSRRFFMDLRYLLLAMFVLFLFALVFVPWQQTSQGVGRVIAYNPVERQQVLGATIKGRILKWYVTEGSFVKKGQVIGEMVDNDPLAMQRMQTQLESIKEQKQLAEEQVIAYKNKIKSLQTARKLRLRANSLKIEMSRQKYKAAKQKVAAIQASLHTASINLRRQKVLRKSQIISRRKLELSELKVAQLRNKLSEAKAGLYGAKAAIVASRAMRLKKSALDASKIDSAKAEYQTAKNKIAYAKNRLAKMEMKVARQSSRKLQAPRDAVVLRLLVGQNSEMLKIGDPVAVIVPKTTKFAVELWVNGIDIPLIRANQEVRLQFEGWPAVQFMGWPSVAVGTFPGKVSLVDATSDKGGKFRVVVTPKKGAQEWPEAPFLRQGARAKGWLFLNNVRLGFELWRQINQFPPSIKKPETKEMKPLVKKPKRK